jgi:type III pantothenate kinase
MSLLCIDVGNTRLKWALYDPDAGPGAKPLAQGAEFLEHIDRLADTAWSQASQEHAPPTRMVGCCVAGDAIRRRVEEQLEGFALNGDNGPHWVVSKSEGHGIANGYDHPTRLGADRFVAMIGARHHMQQRLQEPRYKATTIGDRPLVVVMVGTAVTVDAMRPDGTFVGGFILPGHGIMLKSLQAGTSGLHVPTGEVQTFPTNTSDALTSGGTFAIAGAIETMYGNLQHHCGIKPWCYVSGGAGWKMQAHIAVPHELIDDLLFEGLLVVAQSVG